MFNSIGIARGLGWWWWEVQDNKGDKWGWEETRVWVVNIQCNVQMMYYRIIHLKTIRFINQYHANKLNNLRIDSINNSQLLIIDSINNHIL